MQRAEEDEEWEEQEEEEPEEEFEYDPLLVEDALLNTILEDEEMISLGIVPSRQEEPFSWRAIEAQLEAELEEQPAPFTLPVHFVEALETRRPALQPSFRRRPGPVARPPPAKRAKLVSQASIDEARSTDCCKSNCMQHLNLEDLKEIRDTYAHGSEQERSQQILQFMLTCRDPDKATLAYSLRGQVCRCAETLHHFC